MTIQELIDNLTIQGAFRVYRWNYEENDAEVLAEGNDFECDQFDIKEIDLDKKIVYMYAVDGVLNIEVENN